MKYPVLALIGFAVMTFLTIGLLNCSSDDKEEIEFEQPAADDDAVEEATCEEAFDFLINECEVPLIDTQGIPITEEEAVAGCNACESGNTTFDVYCCMRQCKTDNQTCNGIGEEEGMETCAEACILPVF